MTHILLVDDHAIVRSGLRSLIESHDGLEVVAEADDGEQAIALAARHEPDVIIMDVAMPGINGIEATRQILEQRPETRIITLSMHADSHFVSRMLQAGARGYLLKDCAFDELAGAIQTVLDGQVFLSPEVTDVLVEDYVGDRTAPVAPAADALTKRQREVLRMLSDGGTTRDIADKLKLSVKTIETHRQHIMERLGVRSVAELTKFAIREGLTSLEQ
ncbi:MAG: response regulator transcription factor [Phycisphaerae bacterium]|nr:response regulator transcription factor [Phycisphaerae bacterium]